MASKKKRTSYRWFPENHWKRPNPRPHGDDDRAQKIYHAVGAALSAWEGAEEILADVFLLMMDCNNSQQSLAARRAYGSIDSNTGRRKAILAVAEIYFGRAWEHEEIRKPVQTLIEDIHQAARLRDDIAHGKAITLQVNQKKFGTFLFPVAYNNSRSLATISSGADPFSSMRAMYRYTGDDILDVMAKFNELHNTIMEFLELIRRKDHFHPLIRRFHPNRFPPPKSKVGR